MLIARELPRAEWARLAETPLGILEGGLDGLPAETRLLVIEDTAGAIVGTWALIRYVHVEGVWIHPAHRGRGVVAGRLLREMRRVARDWHAAVVLTTAGTDDVRALVARLGGVLLPGDHYALPVDGRP